MQTWRSLLWLLSRGFQARQSGSSCSGFCDGKAFIDCIGNTGAFLDLVDHELVLVKSEIWLLCVCF